MSEDQQLPQSELSRRSLIGGSLAAAAGIAALSGARPAGALPATSLSLAAEIPGLVYLPLDAFAFDTAQAGQTPYRLYQEITGMQPSTAPNPLYASLPIPTGSVIKQINVAYQGQPIVSVAGRSFSANPATLTDLTTPTMLAAGGGPKSQSLAVTADLTPGATYSIKVACSPGDSILGMTVGYIPAAQAFIPYAGNSPRALDSRSGTPFSVGEERVVDLSTRLIPTARAAVINLTATGTVAAGFLSAFSDGIAFPGNSTLNYIAAGQTVANAAVVTMKAGKIKVRCSDGATHVIVDVIGSLL